MDLYTVGFRCVCILLLLFFHFELGKARNIILSCQVCFKSISAMALVLGTWAKSQQARSKQDCQAELWYRLSKKYWTLLIRG